MIKIIPRSHQNDDYKEVSKIKDTYRESPVNSGSNVNNDQFEVSKPHDPAGSPTHDPKRGLWMELLSEIIEDLVFYTLGDSSSSASPSLDRILRRSLIKIILSWSGVNPVCMPVVDSSSTQVVNSVCIGTVNPVRMPVVYYPSMPVVNSGYIGVVNPVRIPVVYYPSIQVVNSWYIGAVNPVCMPEVKVWHGDSSARTFVWGLWKFNASPGTVE